jgi:hypothetical protein
MSASSSKATEASQSTNSPSTSPLALPAPDVSASEQTHTIVQTIRLDELGPMVVNSDGVCRIFSASVVDLDHKCNDLQTLSRIANWKGMSPHEQERTMRVLGARNKQA